MMLFTSSAERRTIFILTNLSALTFFFFPQFCLLLQSIFFFPTSTTQQIFKTSLEVNFYEMPTKAGKARLAAAQEAAAEKAVSFVFPDF